MRNPQAGPRSIEGRPVLMRRWQTAVFAGAAMAAGLLATAPLAGLIALALDDTGDLWPHLARYVIPAALAQTMLLLAGVAVVTIILGAGTAWIITTFAFPGRDALSWLLPLPLAFPTYIVAYVYVDILDAIGPVQSALRTAFGWRSIGEYWFPNVRSLPGAILLFGFVLYPYVYLAARAVFQTQSSLLVEPARMLGVPPLEVARRISLPLARPAITVGVSLALLETLNDIGASEYLGVQTLTLSIFSTWLNRGSLAGAAQIACLMLLIVIALIALERHARRRRAFAVSAVDPQHLSRIRLTGRGRWIALIGCFVPVALGFLLPAGYLLREVTVRGLIAGFDASLAGYALTTVALASIATVVALALGFSAVAALRYLQRPMIAMSVNIAGIGYALPGTVLALGLLSPLVLLDEGLIILAQAFGVDHVGLILAGSGAALVIAYVIRFLTIAIGFAQAGFSRVAMELDEVARLMGAGPGTLARTIHLPLAQPAILGAALLVFVDCLKELPATLLLRPLNVETLATYIYQFATRGSFEQGSLAALIIVAIGILPVIRVTQYADIATRFRLDARARHLAAN